MKSDNAKLTTEQCKDSGLALVLLTLIGFQIWNLPALVLLAIVFLVAAMTWPPVFRPFARLWFGLSSALGTVMSRVVLTLSFYVLVLPVGLARRAMGKDAMQVKSWKNGGGSVFRVREHRFEAKDLERPY